LPEHFPPHQTACRCHRFRDASPSAAIVDRVFAGVASAAVASATGAIVEIEREQADQLCSAVDPRRWVAQRFLASLRRGPSYGQIRPGL
jgi:hypothetical protein